MYFHLYYHRIHLDQNKQWLWNDTVHFRNGMDSTCSIRTSPLRKVVEIVWALFQHCINGPVHRCHLYKKFVNCRIHIRAGIHHCCSGTFVLDIYEDKTHVQFDFEYLNYFFVLLTFQKLMNYIQFHPHHVDIAFYHHKAMLSIHISHCYRR